MKNCEGPLCVGNIDDALDSVKAGIVYDAADRAYQNAFKLHRDPRKAFEQGKKDADFIFSNVRSVDTSIIRKSLENHYRQKCD